MGEVLDFALDLMRRLPPSQVENNLAGLIDLVPDLVNDLLSAVDQPLKIAYDQSTKKDYLLCDYNRDGDSYRSPWSNRYDPPLADGAVPSGPPCARPKSRRTGLSIFIVICILRAASHPSTCGTSTRASPASFSSRKLKTLLEAVSP